jgi:epoxyqueuosine reductase
MDFLKEKIKAEALRFGFSFIGFAKPQQTTHFSNYQHWLNEPYPEELSYLGKKYVVDARDQPTILLRNAKSVITLGIAFPKPRDSENVGDLQRTDFGQIASYACLPDYHHWLREKTMKLISFIKSEDNLELNYRFFADSGPVMEKDFACLSGLGWIGKNSLFISPVFGSYCLLGCLFVDIGLQPDQPNKNDLCGSCEICIRSCPTKAILKNRTIYANRCISFLTTNYKGNIPEELRGKIGNQVFGCDICQKVCPLNSLALELLYKKEKDFQPIIDNHISLLSELFLTEELYKSRYSGTPIGKFPFELFLRNLIIAIGNSGREEFIDPLIVIFQNSTSMILKTASRWAIDSLNQKLQY